MIERLSFDLFGRHVWHRADHHPGCRYLGRGHHVRRTKHRALLSGQSEVEHLHPTVTPQHHVRRLEVAMRDLLLMRRLERVGERDRQFQEPRNGQAGGGNQRIECLALDQLHREELETVGLFSRIDRDDVRVIEGSDSTGFAREAFMSRTVTRHLGGEDFERNITTESRIVSSIDFTHSACSERTRDLVRPKSCPRGQHGESAEL